MKKYVGAVDQGTTSTRFVIFNHDCEIISMHQLEHRQIYPKPGWVEHDPVEIKNRTFEVIKTALEKAAITSDELSGIGITNQRETTIVWDPRTGDPYYNAIVWQDMRTDKICKDLAVNSDMDCYRHISGLPLATYFSGPKIKWLFDNTNGLKDAAVQGNVLFGNMDTWIIWWLTGGPDGGVHVTDVTNASRTMLMNLKTLDWDKSMLDALGIPEIILPVIRSSSEIYGYTRTNEVFNDTIPVSGDLGDQQAALFGQACFDVGEAKNTYGTGCFLLMNTGEKIVHSKQGLLTTVGYKIGKQPAVYALEGSIAMAGSLVQWLRDNLEFFNESADIEAMAKSVPDNGGIYFVPAFSGLFAPHWRSDARGLIIGMTHYINKGHIARAAIEASAFQTREIFDAMEKDSGIGLKTIKADGGMVVNEILMQFQSDILNIPVFRPRISETTVLGAAFAAGLAIGFWDTTDELKSNWTLEKKWKPEISDKRRDELYNGWLKAVKRTYDWL